ncbi:hypothetical protein Clacol_001604 [Clathrus columnatus]|uniref:Uncharacterized protein n=1 Tax=Clathrus columnatus TaxID=1419009 RepID=A0AAV5A1C9_9AGAM|nr:hypothetical protein Clacol_001604 [Clathrus columnatus]
MDLPRQQLIAKVFFTKYKNTLGPQVIAFIEDILEKHNILDENVAESIEHLAKEYNRQDGPSDAEMVVRLDVLERVYEAMQNAQSGTGEQNGVLDVESHLQFIDAFEMPSWHWSVERNGFERSASKLTLSGSAESRVLALRDRFSVIKQAVLRNENFSPRPFRTVNQETTLKLSSTKDLLGRAGLEFLLLGMLMRNQEGHLCLEDLDGIAHTSEGFFFEGCFVLIEGIYNDEEIISVNAIGHPPCERRVQTRSLYGHVDFLGRGVTSVLEDVRFHFV